MKYFTIKELTRSETAEKYGIDNTPTPEQLANLTILVDECLDIIREKWGQPLYVNSGFRSLELNRAVRGASSSQHLEGKAADITAGSPALNRELFELILHIGYEFDQLVDEQNYTWLHISYNKGYNRKKAFKL